MKNNKTLNRVSASLLAELNEKDKTFFTTEDAKKILLKSRPSAVVQLLRKMAYRGLLLRIKEGLYHIIPYDRNEETYQPNWHLVGAYLFGGQGYYVGYYSALSLHSLTTQPATKEQIVTNSRTNRNISRIKGIEFQIIYHNPSHFFGMKDAWVDSFHKVKSSDIEKTIIDCLFKPEFAGGIAEIAKALFKTKDSLDFKKLLTYLKRFDSQSVIKRLGFLYELLKIKTPITEQLLKMKRESMTSLDPSLPKEGKMFRRWSIQQNIDTETILSGLSH